MASDRTAAARVSCAWQACLAWVRGGYPVDTRISICSCCSCACSEVSQCGAAGMPRPSGQRGTRQWGARWVACAPRHVCPVQKVPAVPAGESVASAFVSRVQVVLLSSSSSSRTGAGWDVLALRSSSRSLLFVRGAHGLSCSLTTCSLQKRRARLLLSRRGLPLSRCSPYGPWRTKQAGPDM